MRNTREERATDWWMALKACNAMLHEARETGFVEPEGWTVEELEQLVADLTAAYLAASGDFADSRPTT